MNKSIPVCRKQAIVQGDCYRFTILTPHMVRLEYNEHGVFEDRATQVVINRDFEVPHYTVIDEANNLEIITDYIHIIYTKQKFSKNSLSIRMVGELGEFREAWYHGDGIKGNLKGTARTLDEADGAIPLEEGLLSRNGYSIIDDSRSLVVTENGWVEVRAEGLEDFYFLGYGDDYLACLKEYYALSGQTPMIPRYALGNWWSRYYKYSEQEYKELMTRFEKEHIPFSVAVIDMDWHLVDIDPKYGSGWTGYTWNKELFPDPKEFMGWLHDKNLKVTLNLHPAEGVKAHEEMYEEMAKELKVDYENEIPIKFDIAEPSFLDAYFKYLHHPNEEDGVDFWWIDWQQGNTSKIPGLDPLWMLNHYHYHDMERTEKRSMIFSRYAGLGSHRYPVGFSGDSIVSWESLAFQPYFTANASNVGYGWWSHDIGGHMMGIKDDEMATRWLQFGVFSPIMRLHSACSPFTGKEPWKYHKEAECAMVDYLQLRHKLLPYIYTMNHAAHTEGLPLVQPMYYHTPKLNIAYKVPNQYYFGSELVVCPITAPMNKGLGIGMVKAWFPEGTWIDFFNGRIYKGNRCLCLYRELNHIPVVAKVGAIVPMEDSEVYTNSVDNPKDMSIQIFAGDSGAFTLYEDDGITNGYKKGHYVETPMTFAWGRSPIFTIEGAQGDCTLIPCIRNYKLIFRAIEDCEVIEVMQDGANIAFEKHYDHEAQTMHIKLVACDVTKAIQVILVDGGKMVSNNIEKAIFELVDKAQISFGLKNKIYRLAQMHEEDVTKLISDLHTLELDLDMMGALQEIILA